MRGKYKTMTRHFMAFSAAFALYAAIFLPTAAYAFDWYGGASAGSNRYEVSGGDYFPQETLTGTTDGVHGAWKAYIGMRLFDKYVSAEFGYMNFGSATVKGTISGAPVRANSKTETYTAALVGLIPIGTKFDALIELGLHAPQTKITTTTGGVSTVQNTSDMKLFGGLGAQFDFSDTISARLEYERFVMGSVGPSYANVLSVGFTYLFYTE